MECYKQTNYLLDDKSQAKKDNIDGKDCTSNEFFLNLFLQRIYYPFYYNRISVFVMILYLFHQYKLYHLFCIVLLFHITI